MPDFGSWGTAWWKPLLFILVAGHITNVCVTLFLHRSQTHRSVKLHYLAALPMGWARHGSVFWPLIAVAVALTVAEYYFAHEDGLESEHDASRLLCVAA